jgi:predicted nucleic acid-binding protein
MRVFLDANILFSGSIESSRTRAFLDVVCKHAQCLTNEYAIDEARRNLQLKRPQHAAALAGLVAKCELISVVAGIPDSSLKAKDRPILGGAIAGKASHLLTGDERDFGVLWGKTIADVKIVSPKMLADEFVKRGWLDRE